MSPTPQASTRLPQHLTLRSVGASFTALVLAAGLAFAGASVASADELPADTPPESVETTAGDPTSDAPAAPAVEPEAEPTEPEPSVTPEAQPEPTPVTGPTSAARNAAPAATNAKTYYYVGIYFYKKLDPTKPAAWENSGLQTLLDWKEGTEWFTTAPPYGYLPEEVCGDGWALQQDKVATTDYYFSFPMHLEYPDDFMGWPPVYDAKHQDLSELYDVPDCDPEKVIPGDPSGSVAQCVDGTVTTGSITVGGETGLVYTIRGLGPLSHIVIDPVTSVVTTGLPVGSYLVSVVALPGYVLEGPDVWPITVEIGTPIDCMQLPDHAVVPTNATVNPPICSTGNGAIVMGMVGGVSFFNDGVTYFINGVAATSAVVNLPPGTYTVTVVPDPGNTLDGPDLFTLAIPASGAACGDLTTLALTGASPAPWLFTAIGLLVLGAVAVAAPRLRTARPADEID